MKKLLTWLLVTLMLISPIYAHPGKTDDSGGHYDQSAGEYHYHHGYPEHQHTDGTCPYNFDDRTGANSGSSDKSSTSPHIDRSDTTTSKPQEQNKSLLYRIGKIISTTLFAIILVLFAILYISLLYEAIKLLYRFFIDVIRNKK